MQGKESIKQILARTRPHWDQPEIRPAVREAFAKVLECGTLALGAEVFASDREEKVVPHSCKSRACPSCGSRATLEWQRQQWAEFPDISYRGICFTMPDVLWPIFQANRHLLHDLPALGAAVIQQWVKDQHGVRLLIMVVQQTFASSLEFKPHLHFVVSDGGLHESQGRWIARLRFNRNGLMRMWRYAVITYLRTARKAMVMNTTESPEALRSMFQSQYERWWNIHITRSQSKRHLLGYATRYIRRPPIAQRRIEITSGQEVRFLSKDKKLKGEVTRSTSLQEFVSLIAEHVPDRYRHGVRYFGLLAPASKGRLYAGVFELLGQERGRRPARLGWAKSLQKYFGVNPLIDSRGNAMYWRGRLSPNGTNQRF